MDPSRFDTLSRALSETISHRRTAIGLLAGGLSVLSRSDTDAKKKKKGGKGKGKGGRNKGGPSTSPPPAGGCPEGQKPCDGDCIPTSQCCNNADCDISGQTCAPSGQCNCPGALPDICLGACLAPCSPTTTRHPGTCVCCTRNGNPSGGDNRICCSEQQAAPLGTFFCAARANGAGCEFDAQCGLRSGCINGVCTATE